ncbi:MAG TPA: papain-like cysteine protease family protein [Pyrinomonadaceae bacterium]|nr:papain-like cysteine protease family protein [Pyrinomonadaceae bacterium]
MRHDVPLIPQSTNMGCWAASIAMILGWQNSASFDPSMIAANPGGLDYTPSLSSGLDPNDRYILEQNGFDLEAPQCYMLSRVQQLVDSNGPLWIASAAPAPHIRLVTGYNGNVLYINDPAPVNRGSQYTSGFENFFGQMETLGSQEMNQKAPVYVAYLR